MVMVIVMVRCLLALYLSCHRTCAYLPCPALSYAMLAGQSRRVQGHRKVGRCKVQEDTATGTESTEVQSGERVQLCQTTPPVSRAETKLILLSATNPLIPAVPYGGQPRPLQSCASCYKQLSAALQFFLPLSANSFHFI